MEYDTSLSKLDEFSYKGQFKGFGKCHVKALSYHTDTHTHTSRECEDPESYTGILISRNSVQSCDNKVYELIIKISKTSSC